jgi:DNA polymerase III epsilon subunit-like protein
LVGSLWSVRYVPDFSISFDAALHPTIRAQPVPWDVALLPTPTQGWRFMITLIFDTETTDRHDYNAPYLHNSHPDIVQLAAILRDEDGRIMSSMDVLLKKERPIQPGALAVHHITDEMCEMFGVWPENALYVFSNLLRNAQVVVAHNISFDKQMIDVGLHRVDPDLKLDWSQVVRHDTMKAATNICKLPNPKGSGYKWPKLGEVYEHFFQEKIDGAHDAMVDVMSCARVYDELVRLNAFPNLPVQRVTL